MAVLQQKVIAAQLMKCGVSRVRIRVGSESEVSDALTRNDVRMLIVHGALYKIQKQGTSRGHAREILRQKKRGRRRGPGSVKGRWGAMNPKKDRWMKNIRTLRRLLVELRDSDQLEKSDYRKLYGMAKGGMFRNRKHMMLHIKESELLKVREGVKTPKPLSDKKLKEKATAKKAKAIETK